MKNNIKTFNQHRIDKFAKDIEKYKIPSGFRMFNGIDLYADAKDDLHSLKTGKKSLDDIFLNPDNSLRNVMKLWTLDKKKLKKK